MSFEICVDGPCMWSSRRGLHCMSCGFGNGAIRQCSEVWRQVNLEMLIVVVVLNPRGRSILSVTVRSCESGDIIAWDFYLIL